MAGSLTSGRFRFQVEGGDRELDLARGFRGDLVEDAFDLRLTGHGTLPDLGGAPVASWVLARLACLTDDRLGLASREDVDGGGYVVEFTVYRLPSAPQGQKAGFEQRVLFEEDELGVPVEPEEPVASFQFQGGMEGVAVLGQRSADCPAEEVLDALAAALLAAPLELRRRELAVRGPEWDLDPEMYRPYPDEGSRNWYGWDGSRFLGKENIREAD